MNVDSIEQILKETNLEFQVDKDVFESGDHIVWLYIPQYTDLTKLDFIRDSLDAEYAEVSYSDEKDKIFVKYCLKSGDNDETNGDNQATVSLDDFDEEADLHLWLADVLKDIHWDDWDKEDGARQLVEEVAYRLGTHGRQLIEDLQQKGDEE